MMRMTLMLSERVAGEDDEMMKSCWIGCKTPRLHGLSYMQEKMDILVSLHQLQQNKSFS